MIFSLIEKQTIG